MNENQTKDEPCTHNNIRISEFTIWDVDIESRSADLNDNGIDHLTAPYCTDCNKEIGWRDVDEAAAQEILEDIIVSTQY